VVSMDNAVWIQKWYGGARPQMFMGQLNYLPLYDADFSYSWFWGKNQPAAARFFDNPQFDTLFEAQRTELDRNKREQLLQQLSAILHDEAPALFLFRQARVHATKPTVKGFVATADQGIYFDEVSLSS
jgi:peptide/nickel transport system substrate-binding protein